MKDSTVEEIMSLLEKIEFSENEIKSLVQHFASSKYYTDLLTHAVMDRSLKLSRGFRILVHDKNTQCAAVISRCQIDNLARFHGIKLYKGKEYDYVYNFMNPQSKFSDLKDPDGKKLSDYHLISFLEKQHSGIHQMYEEFCGYAHLSEKNLKACSPMDIRNINHKEVAVFSPEISSYDSYLNETSYITLTDKFLMVNNILLDELKWYFNERANCSDSRNLSSIINN